MKKAIFTLALMGIFTNSFCQSKLLWSKNIDAKMPTAYSQYPIYPGVVSDNNTIKVSGVIGTPDGQRLLTVNYDLNGDTISTTMYGENSGISSLVVDYEFDAHNNVYVLNSENTSKYMTKMVLLKYTLDGRLIWREEFQNTDTSYVPHSLALANDTSLFVTAFKEYETGDPDDDVVSTIDFVYLYAYNSDGKRLWTRELDRDKELYWFSSGIFVHDNTAFLFGHGYKSTNLVKVDINNHLTVNSITIGPYGSNAVQMTPDNNLLLNSQTNYYFSKADLDGNMIWSRNTPKNLPPNVTGDAISSMTQDAEGNIYLTGWHNGEHYNTPDFTGPDILTLKYDKNGNLIWQNRYVYGKTNADFGNAITLKDGHIYVGGESQKEGGTSDYDYVVLKIDAATGETKGTYRYDGAAKGDDRITSITVLDNGNVAFTGYTYTGVDDYGWTTQLLGDVLSVPEEHLQAQTEIYPNPVIKGRTLTVNEKGFTEFKLVSSLGQVVKSGSINTDKRIPATDVKPGVYMLTLRSSQKAMTWKLVVQ